MHLVTLRDLYIAELQDLLDAEQQTLVDLPHFRAAATSAALQEFLDEHLTQTGIHIERLELLLRRMGAPGNGEPCQAMHGLLREGRRRIEAGERGDVLDAALIGVAQRIEHYEIAAYGCARTYARTLDDGDAAALLQQTLDEEGSADARLTAIAQRGINQSAGEGVVSARDAARARLRYIPASSLRDFKYRQFRVRNDDNEDLGTLDGLILDARTQRPEYFVVDSGGWFVGKRYVLPITALEPEEGTETLRTSLDRKTIAAYPPFSADTFHTATSTEDVPPPAEYNPPTWLMTGVWMTEGSGFACVPPRAQADFTASPDEPRSSAAAPETDLMVARGEPDGRGEAALADPESPDRDDERRR